jgi:hypothetical protein
MAVVTVWVVGRSGLIVVMGTFKLLPEVVEADELLL